LDFFVRISSFALNKHSEMGITDLRLLKASGLEAGMGPPSFSLTMLLPCHGRGLLALSAMCLSQWLEEIRPSSSWDQLVLQESANQEQTGCCHHGIMTYCGPRDEAGWRLWLEGQHVGSLNPLDVL
jgi:hypothetical protein